MSADTTREQEIDPQHRECESHHQVSVFHRKPDCLGQPLTARQSIPRETSENATDRMLIAFHKPYGVLCQFTSDGSENRTLAGFGFPPHVYAVGRLDADSEGLLLLTDEAGFNTRLLHPTHGHTRTYWSQVEGSPTPHDLLPLRDGVQIQHYRTKPARVCVLDPQPEITPRQPPIRERRSIPTTWIELELVEGKNRQVRHMTAAVGFPTLRLQRRRIGNYSLGNLPQGHWKTLTSGDRELLTQTPSPHVNHSGSVP